MNRRIETSDYAVRNGNGYFEQNLYGQLFCALYKSDDVYSHVYAMVQDGKYRKTFNCACPAELNFWLESPYKSNLFILSSDFMNSAIFIAIAVILADDDAKITLITSDKNIEKQSFFDVLSASEGIMEINDIEKREDTFFIVDGRSLLCSEKDKIQKLLDKRQGLNGVLIDKPDDSFGDILEVRMIITADTFSIDDFIFKVLSDNRIREKLGRYNWTRFSEYFVSTNDVERVGRFIEAIDPFDKEEAIMPGNESLIKLLLDNLKMFYEGRERFPIFSKLIYFLVEKGDRYRSRYSYEEDCNLGDIFDSRNFEKSIRIILSLLESSYKAEDFEMYTIVSEFIRNIGNNGCSPLSPDVVCGYFERLSAFITEDAYFYRNENGISLLMQAERILNLQKSYWKIYELILENSKDIWLINAKGENGFRNINISLCSKFHDAISNKGIGNSFDNSGELNIPCFSREHLTALRKEKLPDIALIPAVASAVCFCSEPLKTEYFEYLMELIASCKDINKAVFRNDGKSILMRMISFNTPKTMLEAVLEAGVDINAADWEGDTALARAVNCCSHDPRKIKWLLEHGIHAAIQNKLGETAVNIAARTFSIQETEWNALGEIKDRGAFLLADNYGFTPVMTAFRYMNLPAIRFLILNGYYQSSDIPYINHQIERVKTSTVRKELEDLFQKYVAEACV